MEPRTPAEWKTLFESEAFARQTEYYGPLGVEYTPAGTHLRLWAPTAKQAAVNLYRRGTGGACVGTLPLQQQDKGVWSIYLPGDQHGKYYDFTLTTPFGTCNAADPYARSAGVNGVRSMIFDPARVDPQGWERRPAAVCGRSASGISRRTRPAACTRPGGANFWPLPSRARP